MLAAPLPALSRAPWLALALGFLVGCGGPSDREQIASVVERSLTSTELNEKCESLVSERFVVDVYGDRPECRGVYIRNPGADRIQDARVAATRIDRDKATTRVMYRSQAGVDITGRLALAKVSGTWRIDRLGIDLLRSMVPTFAATNAGPMDVSEARCLLRATRRLSNRALRRVGYAFIGDRIEEGKVPDGVLDCVVESYQASRRR